MSEPDGPPPAAAAPALPVENRRATIEAIGSTVVPATVAFYLVGFIVSVPHFVRAGVPISSLSPQTFVAAGIAFAVVTAFPFFFALDARNTNFGPWWWKRVGNIVWAVVGAQGVLYIVTRYQQWWRCLAFVVVVESLVAFWPYVLGPPFKPIPFPRSREQLASAVTSISGAVGPILSVFAAFAWLIYPVIPLHFGGGRPEPLMSIPMAKSQASAPAQDAWALTDCRGYQESPGAERCRTVYRVHESEDYLFIAIVERAGECPDLPPSWASWPWRDKERTGCFQQVPNSDIRRLETPAKP